MQMVPTQATLYGPGQDWCGRGPSIKRGRTWYHAALDLHNPGPVRAPENGLVIYAIREIPPKNSIFGGYGPSVVVLRGSSGVFHWLGHLAEITVVRGQSVRVGDVVAEKTGTKKPHVHWEIRTKNVPYKDPDYWPWSVSLDPIHWLKSVALTGPDFIQYAKNQSVLSDNPSERMKILGRKYPLKLRFPPGFGLQKIPKKLSTTNKHKILQNVIVGITGGLVILAIVLP